jgi:hypothetical protein
MRSLSDIAVTRRERRLIGNACTMPRVPGVVIHQTEAAIRAEGHIGSPPFGRGGRDQFVFE